MGSIFFYIHDLRSSGVVRNAMILAERCARRHDVTLIAGYGDGLFLEEARRGSYRLVVLNGASGEGASKLAVVLPLRRLLQQAPPGVLVSMGNHGHATPWLACRRLDHIRRVYRISNEVSRGDGLRGAMRRIWMTTLIRDAARIALVGEALGRNPLFARPLYSGQAVAIPAGVDQARAQRMAQAPSPHAWLDEDVPVILGIGRLRPQKNFDLLIAATGLLARERRVRLAILGGGAVAEQARLTGLAAAAGLGEDFLLAGETDNVFAWAARAASFALPSRWEGSSLALLEALAVGTPVVASRLAGDAADVLDHGRYGLLFDGEDADALTAALRVQLSPDRVLPGDRALAYGLSAPAYERLIDELLDGVPA